MKILMVDNYDSFTYNLVHLFEELGAEVVTVRNDAITVEEAQAGGFDRLVISPGPGRPEDAGISIELIRALAPTTPTLGVCLGHQAIALAYGGRVVRAKRLMHGKTCEIRHDSKGVYRGLPRRITVMRYHSLVAERASLPKCLAPVSWADDGSLMGVRHKEHPVEGVQFHPESIMTEPGKALLANFLKM